MLRYVHGNTPHASPGPLKSTKRHRGAEQLVSSDSSLRSNGGAPKALLGAPTLSNGVAPAFGTTSTQYPQERPQPPFAACSGVKHHRLEECTCLANHLDTEENKPRPIPNPSFPCFGTQYRFEQPRPLLSPVLAHNIAGHPPPCDGTRTPFVY